MANTFILFATGLTQITDGWANIVTGLTDPASLASAVQGGGDQIYCPNDTVVCAIRADIGTLTLVAQGDLAGTYSSATLPAAFTPLTVQLVYDGNSLIFSSGTETEVNLAMLLAVSFDPGTSRILTAIDLGGFNFRLNPISPFIDTRYPGASAVDLFNNGYGISFTNLTGFGPPADPVVLLDRFLITGTYTSISVDSTFPSQGGIFGGSNVAINGVGFAGAGVLTNVYFGGIPATNLFLVNDNVITCDNPAHSQGSVFVSVEFNGSDVTSSHVPIYDYLQFFWTLETPGPHSPGDIIEFTAPDEPGQELTLIDQVELTFDGHVLLINTDRPSIILDGVEIWWMFYIIIFNPIQFKFFIPFQLGTFSGPLTIRFLGTQFSGSVLGGILPILFEDASGIYSLAKGQTNDVLYFRQGYSSNISLIGIPNILSQNSETSEDIITDNFFSLLPYPYKILAQNEYEEDFDLDDSILEDFTIISTLQVVVVLRDTRIPSPFIKTAFLP